jgi:ubiquitin-protein ligase
MLKVFPPKTSPIKWQIVNNDLHHYRAWIKGKPSTPYDKGTWEITVDLPPEYPFKPPVINFITPIYHPNIAIGKTQWKWGSNVCLSLVNWNNLGKAGGWKETITMFIKQLEMQIFQSTSLTLVILSIPMLVKKCNLTLKNIG